MVVQHDIPTAHRSFVRVPGSGFDIKAGSEMLDLGRVSSIANMVRVSPVLPPALARNGQPSLTATEGIATDATNLKNSYKRPCPSDNDDDDNNNAKKVRVSLENPATEIVLMIIDTSAGPIWFMTSNTISEETIHNIKCALEKEILQKRGNLIKRLKQERVSLIQKLQEMDQRKRELDGMIHQQQQLYEKSIIYISNKNN